MSPIRIHRWMVRRPELAMSIPAVRWLLALGFIPPGLIKLLGHPFAQLGTEHAIGRFFDAFFQSGVYYGFVGLAQVVAGVLLVWPRTALLGALLYLPIIFNIFVITMAMDFTGTVWVTGLMLLAVLLLLVWDYPRLRPLLGASPEHLSPKAENDRWALRFGQISSIVLGLALLALLLITRNLLPVSWLLPALIAVLVSAPFAAGCWWIRVLRARQHLHRLRS